MAKMLQKLWRMRFPSTGSTFFINRIGSVSVLCRCLGMGGVCPGLEEFFPPGVYEGKNYVDEQPIVGRTWKVSELRARSNSDLHKFWYVLLKERNMLLTMHQECKRLGIPMPGPTRLHKVAQSMGTIKAVIKEREKAVRELEAREWTFDASAGSKEQILSPNSVASDKDSTGGVGSSTRPTGSSFGQKERAKSFNPVGDVVVAT